MSEISLGKLYEEFGLESDLSLDNTAKDKSIGIDDILFDEMYSYAKTVEVSKEEAEQILYELTGEISVSQIKEELKKAEETKETETAEDTKEIKEDPEPVFEEQVIMADLNEEIPLTDESLFINIDEATEKVPKARKSYLKLGAVILGAIILIGGFFAFRFKYTVICGDVLETVYTYSKKPAKVLDLSEITFDANSKIEYEQLKRGGIITITEPFEVTISHDGKTTPVTTTGGYVKELLNLTSIVLGEYDTVSIPLNKYVSSPETITVNRVRLEKHTKQEVIEAPVIDNSDGADYTYTKQGSNGAAIVTYLEKYVNDELVDTIEISRDITTEAQATIIFSMEYNGSLPLSTEIPTEYLRVMEIECTAYYLPGNRTATGKLAQRGYVAVDPSVIPLGTKMFICSADGSYIYGYAQAEDTGGAVKGNIVDLHLDSYEECIIFGRRDMIAYIIEEG